MNMKKRMIKKNLKKNRDKNRKKKGNVVVRGAGPLTR